VKPEAVKAIVDGLKEVGVNFIALLPDAEFAPVQAEILKLSDIKCVLVSSESTGVSVCAGAWLGGKTPALLVPTSGLLVASWPLAATCMAFGIPMIILIPFRGDMGDGSWVMRTYQYTTKPTLETLQIPYSVVSKIDEVKPALLAVRKSASGWLHPACLLLTGEVLW
jgi:sulfopyruvate decarboxylase subunit alpha